MSKKKIIPSLKLSKKLIFGLTILVLPPAAMIIFLAGWLFLSQRIYPNVSVAGVNVSLLRKEDAFDKVSREISQRGAKTLAFKLNIDAVSEQQSYNLELSKQETANPLGEAISEAFDLGRKKIYFPNAIVKLKVTPSLSIKKQVEDISTSVNEPAIDSTLKIYEGEITVTPSQDGTILDEQKVYAMIDDYFNTGTISNPNLPLKISEPKLNFQEASSIKKRLDQIKTSPIKLTFENLNYILDLNTVLSLVDLENSQNSLALVNLGDQKFNLSSFTVNGKETSDSKLTLNNSKLADYLKTLSKDIDRQVQEPLFSVDPNSDPAKPKINEFRPPVEGRQLQIPEAVAAINASLISSNSTEVKLPVKVIEPRNKLANELGVKELVGRGESNFEGSIENRIYNVKLAASRINGVLVGPGEEFSFVNTIGDITAATGYKQAYVIKSGRTVLDDGGGVCQVSTTLFRAVLNSGLPITARTAHAYRVHYYEEGYPPGIDATIFYPSVDFKFKNDSPGSILIQAYAEGLHLTVDLYGTTDGRIVNLTKPVFLSQSPAPPDIRQDDPTLPKGTVKQVDFAAAGANIIFTRTVTKNGAPYINETFKSNFRPWQAIYLVGTKEG